MYHKGDVVICVLKGDYGKGRPAVIVQSDLFNKTHSSIVACPITSHTIKAPLFRLTLEPNKNNGLKKRSQIMVDKVSALKTERIKQKVGNLSTSVQAELDDALKLWLGI